MKYNLVICGGTFDRLHAGHKAFLDFVFNYADSVIIGITSDAYTGLYKKNQLIEPFIKRREAVEAYLDKKNYRTRAKLFAIDDGIGPAADASFPLEAIIATEDTKKGAEVINMVRREKGLSTLPIIAMSPLRGISSSAIRAGKINTQGIMLVDPYWSTKNHTLPHDLRAMLQEPLGDLIQEVPSAVDTQMIITVGDVTTKKFLDKGIFPRIAVVDLLVERKPTLMTLSQIGFSGKEHVFLADNPPAMLTVNLWQAVDNALRSIGNSIIQVTGEEDLAVIPLVLSSPLGWVIFYGQPHAGLVSVPVTSEIKERTYSFLKRFL